MSASPEEEQEIEEVHAQGASNPDWSSAPVASGAQKGMQEMDERLRVARIRREAWERRIRNQQKSFGGKPNRSLHREKSSSEREPAFAVPDKSLLISGLRDKWEEHRERRQFKKDNYHWLKHDARLRLLEPDKFEAVRAQRKWELEQDWVREMRYKPSYGKLMSRYLDSHVQRHFEMDDVKKSRDGRLGPAWGLIDERERLANERWARKRQWADLSKEDQKKVISASRAKRQMQQNYLLEWQDKENAQQNLRDAQESGADAARIQRLKAQLHMAERKLELRHDRRRRIGASPGYD